MDRLWLPLLSLLITATLINASCPPSPSSYWVQSGSKFFTLITTVNPFITNKCDDLDAHLATIDSYHEVDAILNLISDNYNVVEMFNYGPREAKISGLRELLNGTYVWVETNLNLVDSLWLNFDLSHVPNEDCAIFNFDTFTINHDRACEMEAVEICQSRCKALCDAQKLPNLTLASFNQSTNNQHFVGVKIRI